MENIRLDCDYIMIGAGIMGLAIFKNNIMKTARPLVERLGKEYSRIPPGIGAQLLNKKTLKLEKDFIIEKNSCSTHLLNAVSPAFTCSLAMAEH